MAPKNLSHLVSFLGSELRARAVDGAGAMYGKLLMWLPERILLALERLGVPGVGWALCALCMDPERRSGR